MVGQVLNYHIAPRGRVQDRDEDENESCIVKIRKLSNQIAMKQENSLPSPRLRQVKRRPTSLHIGRKAFAQRRGDGSIFHILSKPSGPISVRDILLQGVARDLGHRLQQDPAAFDSAFPPEPAATAAPASDSLLSGCNSQEKGLLHEELQDSIWPEQTDNISEEEKEIRRLSTGMLSAIQQSLRLQELLQLSECEELPYEKIPDERLCWRQWSHDSPHATNYRPSPLSREL